MKWMRLLGYLCISSALLALSAAAQAREGLTPAQETMCDSQDFVTPGLYGLCVAICEAQGCTGSDEGDGTVKFNESCKPSAQRLYDNYQRKATLDDPPLPCVRPACACWTESQIDDVGGVNDSCIIPSLDDSRTSVFLNGTAREGNGQELAYALQTGNGLRCIRMEMNPFIWDDQTIDDEQFRTCRESVITECESRGLQ